MVAACLLHWLDCSAAGLERMGFVAWLDARGNACVERHDLPHVLQYTLPAAHQVALTWFYTVKRQQLGQVVFQYQTKLFVLGSIGPLGGQPLAQARIGDLPHQAMEADIWLCPLNIFLYWMEI